jgi:hypothetical protein
MLYQRSSLSERLVTEGWVDAPKPRLARNLLAQRRAGTQGIVAARIPPVKVSASLTPDYGLDALLRILTWMSGVARKTH